MKGALLGMLITGGLSGVTAAVLLATAHDATLATGEAILLAVAGLEDNKLAWMICVGWFATIFRDQARAALNRLGRLLAIPCIAAERRFDRWLEADDYRRVRENVDRSATVKRFTGDQHEEV